ncbi:O-antigen ligase family protein [Polynucleobacter sp. JS-JIR-II-50]|uniref:O-antigen ligase family protein n=1 Tax=Polynucleobacter sp. JS-JIR-II-50 TaxID=2576919 RepID=UPI001BFEC7F2|nr:O-antigen ligase family protein [Polynucleobacter sp. JS-JIR-II-50]QWE04780.1 hypothetical protein FD963_01645 [Polynucleobacter sp. JS-JIR-II-50]
MLYSVWILPEIAAWRNTSLVIGAALGLYVSYQYRFLLLNKVALPIWLVGMLFIWASFHLLFLSQNPVVQLIEFKGIWKRALLAVIFALGLGLSIANNTERIKKWAWLLIYLGLLMPTLIYLLKWTLTYYGQSIFGLESVPLFLKVYPGSQLFYVPKTDYVVFCLPTLAVALGQILTLLQEKRINWAQLFIYGASIAAVSFVFYGQNIKNGFVYEALLFILFLLMMAVLIKKHWTPIKVGIIALILIGVGFVGYKHIQQNDSWASFAADSKIAVQLDRYQEWKFNGEKGYPLNELGKPVSATNYERIAWGLVGIKLFQENLLGYGLIENSFGPLVNKKWPEASVHLTHAHSGWLDLALGLGLPGIALVLVALILALQLARDSTAPWKNLGRWVLLSTLLLWCTTEVSNNGNFDPLLFWIVLTASLALRVNHKSN